MLNSNKHPWGFIPPWWCDCPTWPTGQEFVLFRPPVWRTCKDGSALFIEQEVILWKQCQQSRSHYQNFKHSERIKEMISLESLKRQFILGKNRSFPWRNAQSSLNSQSASFMRTIQSCIILRLIKSKHRYISLQVGSSLKL